MALEKNVSVDRVEVLGYGAVHVRTKIATVENGTEVDSSYHRHVIMPGDDYSKECDEVKTVCSKTHTADVIAAYQAATAAQGV